MFRLLDSHAQMFLARVRLLNTSFLPLMIALQRGKLQWGPTEDGRTEFSSSFAEGSLNVGEHFTCFSIHVLRDPDAPPAEVTSSGAGDGNLEIHKVYNAVFWLRECEGVFQCTVSECPWDVACYALHMNSHVRRIGSVLHDYLFLRKPSR